MPAVFLRRAKSVINSMEKMWAGRFVKKLDSKADDFNSSIRFDCKMYRQDIIGSIAHAEMLAKQGIICAEDCGAIIDGLSGILSDIENGVLSESDIDFITKGNTIKNGIALIFRIENSKRLKKSIIGYF